MTFRAIALVLAIIATATAAGSGATSKTYVGSGLAATNCDDQMSDSLARDFPALPPTHAALPENFAGACFGEPRGARASVSITDVVLGGAVCGMVQFWDANGDLRAAYVRGTGGTVNVPPGAAQVNVVVLPAGASLSCALPHVAGQPTTGVIRVTFW